MKYHSTLSTVVISISIALLFLLVSVFILASLNMTSPTLILTNKIFDSWENMDSDIAISFSSIERNLRDRVFINGLTVKYKEQEVVYFDKLVLERGLFSFIGYLLSGNGILDINCIDGRVTIPNLDGPKEGSDEPLDIISLLSNPLNIKIPDALSAWGFNLNIDNIDFVYNDIKLDDISIDLYFDHGIEKLNANISIPKFGYEKGAIGANLDGIVLALSEDEGFDIKLRVDNSDIKAFGAEAKLDSLELSTEFETLDNLVLLDLPIKLKAYKIAANGFGSDITLEDSELAMIDRVLYFNSFDNNISYNNLNLFVDKVALETANFEFVSIALDNAIVSSKESDFVSIGEASANLNIQDRNLQLSIPKLDVGFINSLTNGLIGNIELNEIESSVEFSNGLDANLNGKVSIFSSDKFIDGSGFDFDANLSYINGKLGYGLELDNITISKIMDGMILFLNGSGKELSLGLKYLEHIYLEAKLHDSLDLSLMVDKLPLDCLLPLVDEYSPSFKSYISPDTNISIDLESSLSFDKNAKLFFIGDFKSLLNLENIQFDDSSFSMGIDIIGELKENAIEFDDFRIFSDLVDIDYKGMIDFSAKLPEGSFAILGKDDSPLFNLDMTVSDLREYTFFANTPLVENFYITGIVNFSTENLITSDATLNLFDRINPFDLRIELDNKVLKMDNDNINIDVSWKDILDLSIEFANLPLSANANKINPTALDLTFDLKFDFAKQRFDMALPVLSVTKFNGNDKSVLFSLVASGNNEGINVSEIIFNSRDYSSLSGAAILDMDEDTFSLSLNDGVNEKYMISVIKQEEGYFGILRGEKISLGRFGLDNMIGNLNLTGRAEKLSDFAFSGTFDSYSEDSINDSRSIYGDLFINNELISLTNIEYSNDNIVIKVPSFSFDCISGEAKLDGVTLLKTLNHDDRDYFVSGGLSSSATFTPGDSLISTIFNLIKTKGEGAKIDVTVDYVDVDNALSFEDRSFCALVTDSGLKMEGEFLSGYFDMNTSEFDVSINANPIAALTVSGKLGDKSALKVHIDHLAVSLVNLVLPMPILVFNDPSSMHGDVEVVISEEGFDVFGTLVCDYAEFSVWWLPEQLIILHNATFVIWDNDITTVMTNATILDKTTHSKIPAQIDVGLYFDEGFAFDSWDLDVYIDQPNRVNFRLPMLKSNIDMIGKANGHFRIEAGNGVVNNMGSLTVDDVVISVGMRELPEWWDPKMKVTSNFDLLLRENVQIVYPLGPSPILQATIAENTKIKFSLDAKGALNLSGDINLRSGEIFYFQKYFYITEGEIAFRKGSVGIDPIVNLRARLRDFDANGESVDIYLVLRDATLSNLSPTFESSPSKDLNEIMSILGQSILPSTAYGDTSFATVVSMAAASVDILSRVGLINGVDNGLTSTIRDSLSIDTFSLHTNILSNLVTDTVSLASSSSSMSAFSPMARYLDGTSLYLGKYLSPDLYLQAMVHLSANRNNEKNRFSFIADDLLMDTEISLEWTNPMCTVTFFSQPVNLTPYGILDSFGFSLTKRIVF